MRRLSEKLLALLLALLLGLSTMQGAVAGFAPVSDQVDSQYQMADLHASPMHMTTGNAAHDCEHCNSGNCATDHACSSSQCVSCVLAIMPTFSHSANLLVMSTPDVADDGFVNPLSSSLFRPPKA